MEPRDWAIALARITRLEDALDKEYIAAKAKLEGARRYIKGQWREHEEIVDLVMGRPATPPARKTTRKMRSALERQKRIAERQAFWENNRVKI